MVPYMPSITIGPDAATFQLRPDVDLERLRQSLLTSRLVRIPVSGGGELWLNAGAAPWWTVSE